MKFNKTTMSLALTAAMFGSVAVTQQAFAVPDIQESKDGVIAAEGLNTILGAGSGDAILDAMNASASSQGNTYVSPNNMGQALIYPYYTVRNGFRTTINVFNSSSTRAVAVKVRFREFQNSRDVLDFNLILSPNDKWYGVVKEDDTKGAVLTTSDESCTVPKIVGSSAPFSKAGYNDSNFNDSGDQGLSRLKSGYVEIIPMAWSHYVDSTDDATKYVDSDDKPLNSAAAALHVQPSGVPLDCGYVVDAFTPVGGWAIGGDENPGNGQPTIIDEIAKGGDANGTAWEPIPRGANPLFGEYGIFNAEGGVAGGSNAIALADWMTDTTLFTAQQFPFYLEPTLATAAGVWDTRNLGDTDRALTSSQVLNEWANNESNGAHTDWVVTMPTKSFHVDQDEHTAFHFDGTVLNNDSDNTTYRDNIQAGSSIYRRDRSIDYDAAGVGVASGHTAVEPFKNIFKNGSANIGVSFDEFNNEEGTTGGSGTVNFSPGTSFGTPILRYEANVIRFGGDDVLKSGNMSNDDPVALVIDPLNDIPGGKKHGFLKLNVTGGPIIEDTNSAGNGIKTTTFGLPMVGFAVKERNQGDATKSYGQMFDHKWINNITTQAH